MGRRRSGAYLLQKRTTDVFKRLKLKRIKARSGLQCPRCYHLTMFIEQRGLLVLIGCKNCGVGELLPRHPTLKAVDLYHAVVDNWTKGKIPVFRYERLPESIYDYLQDHVTLGKIVCDEVEEE